MVNDVLGTGSGCLVAANGELASGGQEAARQAARADGSYGLESVGNRQNGSLSLIQIEHHDARVARGAIIRQRNDGIHLRDRAGRGEAGDTGGQCEGENRPRPAINVKKTIRLWASPRGG